MTQVKNGIFLLLTFFLFGVTYGEDVFGMKLTTESLKTKENVQYRFHYFVKDDKTGDYKRQEETKEGDSVEGSYTLVEPNGDLRTVTYNAKPGKGFQAKVDVQPSNSSIKHTTESTYKSTKSTRIDKGTTLESKVQHFPGGFMMDVLSKPQPEVKSEIGVKFSLKTNSVSPTSSSFTAVLEEKPTTENTFESGIDDLTTSANLETSTIDTNISTDTRNTDKDPVEKEIDEVFNSMPKIPEFVLPDNKTHFKFYKDPEEAFLDERISQIARQLAETSLRREYEERKLGHFIPISLSSVEPRTSSYLSKSFKFTKNSLPSVSSTEPPVAVLTHLRLIPEYVYKHTFIPSISPINYRIPVVNPSKTMQTQQRTEPITNPTVIYKIKKINDESNEMDKFLQEQKIRYTTLYETTDSQPISIVPFQVPTFFQFFSPYVMQTQGSFITPNRAESDIYDSTLKNNLKTEEVPINYDTTFNGYVTGVNEQKQVTS